MHPAVKGIIISTGNKQVAILHVGLFLPLALRHHAFLGGAWALEPAVLSRISSQLSAYLLRYVRPAT